MTSITHCVSKSHFFWWSWEFRFFLEFFLFFEFFENKQKHTGSIKFELLIIIFLSKNILVPILFAFYFFSRNLTKKIRGRYYYFAFGIFEVFRPILIKFLNKKCFRVLITIFKTKNAFWKLCFLSIISSYIFRHFLPRHFDHLDILPSNMWPINYRIFSVKSNFQEPEICHFIGHIFDGKISKNSANLTG